MTKQTDITSGPKCHAVDPERLAAGQWSHKSNRQIDEKEGARYGVLISFV